MNKFSKESTTMVEPALGTDMQCGHLLKRVGSLAGPLDGSQSLMSELDHAVRVEFVLLLAFFITC